MVQLGFSRVLTLLGRGDLRWRLTNPSQVIGCQSLPQVSTPSSLFTLLLPGVDPIPPPPQGSRWCHFEIFHVFSTGTVHYDFSQAVVWGPKFGLFWSQFPPMGCGFCGCGLPIEDEVAGPLPRPCIGTPAPMPAPGSTHFLASGPHCTDLCRGKSSSSISAEHCSPRW